MNVKIKQLDNSTVGAFSYFPLINSWHKPEVTKAIISRNTTCHITKALFAKPYHTGSDDRDKTNLKPIKRNAAYKVRTCRLKLSSRALPQRAPTLRLCIMISNKPYVM